MKNNSFLIIFYTIIKLKLLFEGEFLYGEKRNGKLYDYNGESVSINMENLGNCEIKHVERRGRGGGRGGKIIFNNRKQKRKKILELT